PGVRGRGPSHYAVRKTPVDSPTDSDFFRENPGWSSRPAHFGFEWKLRAGGNLVFVGSCSGKTEAWSRPPGRPFGGRKTSRESRMRGCRCQFGSARGVLARLGLPCGASGLWFRFVFCEPLPPFGRLVGLVPGVVELHQPLQGLGQAASVALGNLGF